LKAALSSSGGAATGVWLTIATGTAMIPTTTTPAPLNLRGPKRGLGRPTRNRGSEPLRGLFSARGKKDLLAEGKRARVLRLVLRIPSGQVLGGTRVRGFLTYVPGTWKWTSVPRYVDNYRAGLVLLRYRTGQYKTEGFRCRLFACLVPMLSCWVGD
jgi:hypothetical protein